LRDAGNYIAGLPKSEHDAFAWRAAIQALMLVVAHGGDTMLPRIGIMRALYPGETAPTPRKKVAKNYRLCQVTEVHFSAPRKQNKCTSELGHRRPKYGAAARDIYRNDPTRRARLAGPPALRGVVEGPGPGNLSRK
jgi:hypothetical protein